MDFEELTSSPHQRPPAASIHRDKKIYLNKSAALRYGLLPGVFIVLGYDKTSMAVSLRISKKAEPGARKILSHKNKRGTLISIKTFLMYKDVPCPVKQQPLHFDGTHHYFYTKESDRGKEKNTPK